MAAQVNKNISLREYLIVGFDNGNYFKTKYSVSDLLSNNVDTDTETLYTIQELYIDAVLDLKVKESLVIKSKRDTAIGDDAVICRIS